LVREHAKVVFEVLAEHRGLVFVCGYVFRPLISLIVLTVSRSSGRMPQAVRQALTWVFETQGDMTITDAELYLSKMEKEGRYKQETW
jgi:sulfite reductase alpha subunit-like flavoprotein